MPLWALLLIVVTVMGFTFSFFSSSLYNAIYTHLHRPRSGGTSSLYSIGHTYSRCSLWLPHPSFLPPSNPHSQLFLPLRRSGGGVEVWRAARYAIDNVYPTYLHTTCQRGFSTANASSKSFALLGSCGVAFANAVVQLPSTSREQGYGLCRQAPSSCSIQTESHLHWPI